MVERARSCANTARLNNIEVRLGDATALSVEDGCVDVVMSNGVLKLVPEKDRAFSQRFSASFAAVAACTWPISL